MAEGMVAEMRLSQFIEGLQILSKYIDAEDEGFADTDYGEVGIPIEQNVSPEDDARLLELGWHHENPSYCNIWYAWI